MMMHFNCRQKQKRRNVERQHNDVKACESRSIPMMILLSDSTPRKNYRVLKKAIVDSDASLAITSLPA